MPPCWRFGNAWNDGNRGAWEAECAIFGREDAAVSGGDSGLTVQNQSENDARIRNLVSAIKGCSVGMNFYLIGQDFTPSAKTIGVEYGAVYSEGGRGFLFGGWKEYISSRASGCGENGMTRTLYASVEPMGVGGK